MPAKASGLQMAFALAPPLLLQLSDALRRGLHGGEKKKNKDREALRRKKKEKKIGKQSGGEKKKKQRRKKKVNRSTKAKIK